MNLRDRKYIAWIAPIGSDSSDSVAVGPYNEDKHRLAAVALCQKMGWKGELVAGALKDGYVFVFLDPVPPHHPECHCANHRVSA